MQAHSGLDGRVSGSGSLRGQSGGEQQVDAMIKKLLTRVLILVTVLVLTYFALLSRDVESVRFVKSPQEAREIGVRARTGRSSIPAPATHAPWRPNPVRASS